MWLLKTKAVPFVVGALGLIKKGTQEKSNRIPGLSREFEKDFKQTQPITVSVY